MGMSVKEFECGTYYDVMLRVEGFRRRMAHEEDMFRNVTYYSLLGPHIQPKKLKGMTKEKFWPIPEVDKQTKAPKMTPERQKRVASLISEIKRNGKA